jgi:hypothetical protein
VFAIIDDHNAMKDHNKFGNVLPFAEAFHCPIKELDDLLDNSTNVNPEKLKDNED